MTQHQRLKEHLVWLLSQHVTFKDVHVGSLTVPGEKTSVLGEIKRLAREIGLDGLAEDPEKWARKMLAQIVQELV